ncbi:hypothetical protein GGP41_002869 [Bipolaris sorokiniana]|uniref:Uncharacterized protein n=1 Tax=Cochliobolus sativus TaxID=45130 RepID=A0A8H5Z7Z8_COCSA|nr:hypothetical protein GGP41_002869 [Bipolaris sorokiniana]
MVQLGSHAWTVRSLVLLAALFHLVSSSIIATFTDDQCKNAFQSFTVENGYPNGTCSRLADNGKYGSFQVVGLDPGCSVLQDECMELLTLSATIYGADAEEFVPCSSTALQFAQIAACYNASWVYYSVDMCTPPNPTINPSHGVKPEIYTSEANAHEIGRNSLYIPPEQPPAELEGSAAVQDEKRGI